MHTYVLTLLLARDETNCSLLVSLSSFISLSFLSRNVYTCVCILQRSVLPRVAVCCSVLRGMKRVATATHYNTLQYTATRCNTLQHAATHHSALQRTATHYTTLHQTAPHCTTLHHTAPHCTTPQHTLTHRTLQHTYCSLQETKRCTQDVQETRCP